jgi:tetratricopeptide (TPR) repeat protein
MSCFFGQAAPASSVKFRQLWKLDGSEAGQIGLWADMSTLRLRILTVVWGREFVDRFLNLTLRSLASENNLPALAAKFDLVYEVVAPQGDISYVQQHDIYRDLAPRVRFDFRPFQTSHIDTKNSMSHWTLWNQAIERAKTDDVYIITVAADHVFADGAMSRWAELFEQGYLAIYCPGMQVVAETTEAELERDFAGSTVVSLPRDKMFSIMFRHFHPVMLAMCRASPRWMAHPEFHLRGIRGHGIAQRIMTSHAVAFNPARIAMTENFCPREKLDKVAYEPSWFLSAEPFLKYLNLYLRPWRMDDLTLSHYGVWGDGFFLAANLRESAHTYSYALEGQSISPAEFKREDIGAGRYAQQMQASRSIYRVWRALNENGQHLAARWLAAAHLLGRLRRKIALRGPVTILVPDDPAIAATLPVETGRLLSGNLRPLIDVMRGHVFAGHVGFEPGVRFEVRSTGSIVSATGTRFAFSKRGPFRIVRGPIEIDDARIWIVDRPIEGVTDAVLTPRAELLVAGRRAKATLRGYAGRARTAGIGILRRNPRTYMFARDLREKVADWQRARAGSPAAAANGSEGTVVTSGSPRVAIVSEKSLVLYKRALNGVAHRAMLDLYDMYEGTVLDGSGVTSVVGGQVKSVPAMPLTTIVELLEKAVGTSPEFAEAWLELGYARRASGDRAGAHAAFDRARGLTPYHQVRRGQSDMRAVAAHEMARGSVEMGEHSAALGALNLSGVMPPYPWQLHMLKAGLLRDTGDAAGALAEIERAMQWNHYEGRFEGMLPRSFEEMLAAIAEREAAS